MATTEVSMTAVRIFFNICVSFAIRLRRDVGGRNKASIAEPI
jgi:hypothetical protein